MATRAVFTPFAAEMDLTNFPQLQLLTPGTGNIRRPVLSFDAATSEACFWTSLASQGLTGTLTAVISYVMASATTGNVVFRVQIEAITDGDATDLDAASSFDTANSATVAVPGTAGFIDQAAITLTTNDSLAVADYFRLRLDRDAANASDTAAGDCHVLAVEFRDAA